MPFNLTGHPAISLPMGFDTAGLPIGLQLVGRFRGEADLLRASALFEAASGLVGQLQAELNALLSSLKPRDQAILKKRFGIGLNQTYTLEEIGEMYQLTRERIRQIQERCLRQLRKTKKEQEKE